MTNQEQINVDESNNRDKIIAAAYRVLAEQGFEQASIKEIAHAADVAPGLIHYYFKNKDQLLVAVLKEASDRYTEEMLTLIASVHGGDSTRSFELAQAALDDARQRVQQHPEGYRLRYELFAMGLRNPATTEGVRDLLDNARQGITHVLRQLAPHHSEAELSAISANIIASFDGLALQKLVDPQFDLDAGYTALQQLLASILTADRR